MRGMAAIFWCLMNAASLFCRIVGLALLAAAPLCLGGTGVSVGVYQPEGLNAAVLPEFADRALDILCDILRPALRIVDNFSVETARGPGGFGSTGVGQAPPA